MSGTDLDPFGSFSIDPAMKCPAARKDESVHLVSLDNRQFKFAVIGSVDSRLPQQGPRDLSRQAGRLEAGALIRRHASIADITLLFNDRRADG